jgi:gas vesicle protein
MTENKESHLMEGLVLGGLLGAALGMLCAPSAGEKTREKIKEKLKELELGDIIDRFSAAFEEGKKEADRAMKETEEKN